MTLVSWPFKNGKFFDEYLVPNSFVCRDVSGPRAALRLSPRKRTTSRRYIYVSEIATSTRFGTHSKVASRGRRSYPSVSGLPFLNGSFPGACQEGCVCDKLVLSQAGFVAAFSGTGCARSTMSRNVFGGLPMSQGALQA
jgi:hypothetical protein